MMTYCPIFSHVSWIFAESNINQQNMPFNIPKLCVVAILKQLMQLKLQMVLFLLCILEKRSNPTNNGIHQSRCDAGNPWKYMRPKPNFARKTADCQTVLSFCWNYLQQRVGIGTRPKWYPKHQTRSLARLLHPSIAFETVIQKVRKRKLSDSANRKHKQPNREQTKQRNIVQMLKELRTASDSEVYGCNPDSDSSSDEK